jgi:hypothetical protein
VSFRVHAISVDLTEPPTVRVRYSYEGKRPDAPALRKAAVEALRYALQRAEEGIEVTGTYSTGRTVREDELRVKEAGR